MTVVKMMGPLLTFLSPLPFFYYALSSAYFVIEKNTLTTDAILNDYFFGMEWFNLDNTKIFDTTNQWSLNEPTEA